MPNLNVKNIYEWPFKSQMIVFGLIFVIVFIMGYMWDISSLKSKLSYAREQEADLKQQIQLAINNEAKSKLELTQYPVLQSMLATWKQKLIPPSKLDESVKNILKIGSANNIEISLFDPEDPVKEGSYEKVPINTVLVGTYNQLADFISQVANLPNIVVINDFIITNENKEDELGAKLAEQAVAKKLLTAKIRLEIYILSENKSHAK